MNKKTKIIFKFSSIFTIASLISMPLSSCSGYLTYESSVQIVVSKNNLTLADQSFNESTYNGLRNFFKSIKLLNPNITIDLPNANDSSIKENNGLWKKPGLDSISRIATYKYAFEDGAKIIIATGYNQQDSLQKITSTKKEYSIYKKTFENNAFIFVDGAMESGGGSQSDYNSNPYNVSSISYRADDGAFLVGIATCVFLNKYQDYFKQNNSLGVSAFVGLPTEDTLSFFNGFRLGIHYWNKVLYPIIKTVDGSKPTLPIKWIDSINEQYADSINMSNFVSTSYDVNEKKVSTIVSGMRKNGANAIFPVAGPQTSLVVNQIASNNINKTIVIGCDTAQENNSSLISHLPNGENIGNGNVIQFSLIKNLEDTTKGILNAIVNGYNGEEINQGLNGFYGLGWNNVGTLSNVGIGISEAGLKYLINPNFVDWKNLLENQNLNYENITLNWLLENEAAKELNPSDFVIKEYIKLLSGNLNTKISLQNSNDEIQKIYKLINNTNGKNGPEDNGYWKIYNNINNEHNNFISVKLSNLIPAIKNNNDDVIYHVIDENAKYVGLSTEPINPLFYKQFSIDNMFLKKH